MRKAIVTASATMLLAGSVAAPVAADWSEKITGGGQAVAGGIPFSITTSASDVGGQIQYASAALEFHATVECTSVAVDGSSAVAAGPYRVQSGAFPGNPEWVQIEVLEGGTGAGDRVRVHGVSAAVGATCTPTNVYPGEIVDGNFSIRTR